MILNFHKKEKETIGAAWARFSLLTHFGPDLSIPNHVLLQHFWLGLSKESALQLNIATRGSFTHKATMEGEALLDRILKNTPSQEPLRVEPKPSHEEVSSAKAKPTPPIRTSSLKPKDLEEGFHPSDLSCFEDDFFYFGCL